MPKYDFNYHPRQVGVLNHTGQVGYTYHPRQVGSCGSDWSMWLWTAILNKCVWGSDCLNMTLNCHYQQMCVGQTDQTWFWTAILNRWGGGGGGGGVRWCTAKIPYFKHVYLAQTDQIWLDLHPWRVCIGWGSGDVQLKYHTLNMCIWLRLIRYDLTVILDMCVYWLFDQVLQNNCLRQVWVCVH